MKRIYLILILIFGLLIGLSSIGIGIYNYKHEGKPQMDCQCGKERAYQPLNQQKVEKVNIPNRNLVSQLTKDTTPVSRSYTTNTILKVLPKATNVSDWRNYLQDKLEIRPWGDELVVFEKEKSYSEQGRKIWSGKNEKDTVLAVAARDHIIISIYTNKGSEIQTIIRNGKVLTEEKTSSAQTCATDEISEVKADIADANIESSADANITYISEVICLYNDDVLKVAGTEDVVRTQVLLYLTKANSALEASKITNFKWHLMTLMKIPYFDTSAGKEFALYVISSPTYRSDIEASAFVENIKNTWGPDQVILYVNDNTEHAGIATLFGNTAVVAWSANWTTTAHELVHNFGVLHDRVTEKAKDNNGKYNYGYRFATADIPDNGTIMAYSSNRIPYYSNPWVLYKKINTGLPEDDPKAAYAAKCIVDYAPTMASTRSELKAPIIISNPEIKVEGTMLDISVGVDGGNLKYQWYKDDIALTDSYGEISGATTDHLNKSVITGNDSGTYKVVITNNIGSVSASVNFTANISLPEFTKVASFPDGLYLGAKNIIAATAINGTCTYSLKVNGVLIESNQPNAYFLYIPTKLGANTITIVATNETGSTEVNIPVNITRKVLTVTALNRYKRVGSNNPILTYKIDGLFVESTINDIDVLPTATTSATEASPVGTYPINISDAKDDIYDFTYVNGTLTVKESIPAPILVSDEDIITEFETQRGYFIETTSLVDVTYTWEVSTDQGVTWTKLSDTPPYSNTNKNCLLVAVNHVLTGNLYRCRVTDIYGQETLSRDMKLIVYWNSLSAISARARAGTGTETLILGVAFANGGKPTIVRGTGPGLSEDVKDYLKDPRITIYSNSTSIGFNDNWNKDLSTLFAKVGLGPLKENSLDAAIEVDSNTNIYTAHLSGSDSTRGIALAEIYDADYKNQAKWIKALSIRNYVGTGADILIAGIVIDGDIEAAWKKLIIRGVGPELAKSVDGYLVNPELKVYQRDSTSTTGWTLIEYNDDWDSSDTYLIKATNKVGLTHLTWNSKDAVICTSLPKGIYTIQLSGVNNTTGIGLIEVYEVPEN